MVMIFLEPPGHLVQRDQPCRGQNSHLAHSSAERLAKITRPLNVPPAAHQHRTNRRAQALGQAEHHRCKAARQLVHGNGERGGGVEDPCTIQMHGQARIGGAGPDFFRYFQRHYRAAGQVVRILE